MSRAKRRFRVLRTKISRVLPCDASSPARDMTAKKCEVLDNQCEDRIHQSAVKCMWSNRQKHVLLMAVAEV
jgi:hypothetical protein